VPNDRYRQTRAPAGSLTSARRSICGSRAARSAWPVSVSRDRRSRPRIRHLDAGHTLLRGPGLLHPARRGTSRIFGPIDRQRLALIIRAKNLGLTLEEIGEHLAIYDADTTDVTEIAALKARMDRHIATLVSKRHDLQTTLKELRDIRLRLASCLARPRKQ
jgi:DNA-binding transcriptional MerR regulator